MNWKDQSGQTNVHASALITWIIHEDSTTAMINSTAPAVNNTMIAFESVLELDLLLDIGYNQTIKQIQLNVDDLQLNGLNVTVDNLGGSVKNDESGIKFRLSGVVPVIQREINMFLKNIPINLPEFTLIDYTLKFDYQDSALGLGLNVVRK